MKEIFTVILLGCISILSSWWVFAKVLRIAKEKNLVDNPDARKLQKEPVPVLGGIAVFFGMMTAILCCNIFFDFKNLLPVVAAMAIMLYIGTLDDILSLSPGLRFLIEILVVLAFILCDRTLLNDFHGLWGIGILPVYFSVPLTVVACVGIINAINMIDGVNGLCSGFCIVGCLLYSAVFIAVGDMESAVLAVVALGAVIPFFVHNVFGIKSKMFIGDGGTLLFGMLFSFFVTRMIDSDSLVASAAPADLNVIAFALATLTMPVFDTLRVMISRMMRGSSPFYPDKTHFHHILFEMNFSHIGTTVTIVLMNLSVVLFWFISYKCGASVDMQFYLVLLLGVLYTFGFAAFFRYHKNKSTKIYAALCKFGNLTHVGHTAGWKKCRDWLDKRV